MGTDFTGKGNGGMDEQRGTQGKYFKCEIYQNRGRAFAECIRDKLLGAAVYLLRELPGNVE